MSRRTSLSSEFGTVHISEPALVLVRVLMRFSLQTLDARGFSTQAPFPPFRPPVPLPLRLPQVHPQWKLIVAFQKAHSYHRPILRIRGPLLPSISTSMDSSCLGVRPVAGTIFEQSLPGGVQAMIFQRRPTTSLTAFHNFKCAVKRQLQHGSTELTTASPSRVLITLRRI